LAGKIFSVIFQAHSSNNVSINSFGINSFGISRLGVSSFGLLQLGYLGLNRIDALVDIESSKFVRSKETPLMQN